MKEFKTSNDITDFIKFKQARAKAKRLILASKKDSWEKFIKEINSTQPIQQIWQNIKKTKQ